VWIFDKPRLSFNFAINDTIFSKVILQTEGQMGFLEFLKNAVFAEAKALYVN
jgi:hypothetical protein